MVGFLQFVNFLHHVVHLALALFEVVHEHGVAGETTLLLWCVCVCVRERERERERVSE